MYKIEIPKKTINPNKLHDELGDLGIDYTLTHNEEEIELLFLDLFERNSEISDENGTIANNKIAYEKRVMTKETEIDEDGKEVIKSVESFTTFDLDELKAKIDAIIEVHDPTPIPAVLSSEEEIMALKQDVTSANDATLTAYEALTEIYEMTLELKNEIEALKGGNI